MKVTGCWSALFRWGYSLNLRKQHGLESHLPPRSLLLAYCRTNFDNKNQVTNPKNRPTCLIPALFFVTRLESYCACWSLYVFVVYLTIRVNNNYNTLIFNILCELFSESLNDYSVTKRIKFKSYICLYINFG